MIICIQYMQYISAIKMCDYTAINKVSLRLAEQYNSKLDKDGLLIYTAQSPVYTEYIRSIEVRRLLALLSSKLQSEDNQSRQMALRWLFVAKLFEQMFTTSIEQIVDPVLAEPKYTYNEYMQQEFIDHNLPVDILQEMIPQVRVSLKRIAEYVDNYELVVKKETVSNRGRGRGTARRTGTITRWRISYGPSTVYISNDVREWLMELHSNTEGNDISTFDSDMYKMITRYLSIGNVSVQASAPLTFYKYIMKEMGVHHECFASPLNSNMNSYTSAYPDVDYPFGSLGNFFQLKDIFPDGGSFAANPPFFASIMDSMMVYIVNWMNSNTVPLSFVIIMPLWKDNNAYNIALQNSHLITYDAVIPKQDHRYVLRRLDRDELRNICDTKILILQNDLGAERWTITEEQAEGMITAFNV